MSGPELTKLLEQAIADLPGVERIKWEPGVDLPGTPRTFERNFCCTAQLGTPTVANLGAAIDQLRDKMAAAFGEHGWLARDCSPMPHPPEADLAKTLGYACVRMDGVPVRLLCTYVAPYGAALLTADFNAPAQS